MKLHIFQKLDRSYFKRIGVDLMRFQEHSITIQCGKGMVELFWDEEYFFKDLDYGNIHFIYLIDQLTNFDSLISSKSRNS